MANQYTTIDGQRVEVTVAANFRAMAAEFARVFGLTLHVRSGVRTKAEQLRLYNGWINRLPGFNLALHPDNPLAYHVETNPRGPRALDLYDSGSDAGASVAGSRRNNWIRDNGPRWGFTLAGLTFTPIEGWHIEFTKQLTGAGGSTDGGSWPARARYGEAWVKAAQTKLTALGLYSGELDGKDGPGTQSGTKALQAALGVDQDGIYGPVTNTGADVILAGRNLTSRPVSAIQTIVGAQADNQWGPLTSFAVYKWQKAKGLTADAVWGAVSDAKAFPSTSTPTTPPPASQVAAPRTPTYAPAARAWSLPWAAARTDKVECIFLHHQGGTGDDEGYFKTKNERSSWPTFQVKASGEVVEFAEPTSQRPSSTQNNNGNSLSIETQNASGAPLWGISDPSHESIARIVAWASKKYGFPIDTAHVRKHSEVYATACPGPSMDVTRIIKRAIEINAPTPTPDTVAVDRSWLQGVLDKLKQLLGGSK